LTRDHATQLQLIDFQRQKGNEACNPLQSMTYAKQTSSEVDVKEQTADPCARRRFNNPVSKPKSIFMKPCAHSS